MESTSTFLTEILVGVVGTIMAIIGLVLRQQLANLKKRIEEGDASDNNKEKEELKSLGINMLCDRVINDIVAETRVLNGASRAYVIRFHNGTFFSGKQPVWKITCTHESTAKGISYETLNIQGLPATSALEVILPFWGEKSQGVTRVDEVTEDTVDPRKGIYYTVVNELRDSMTKQHLAGQNIRRMINIPLTHPEDGRVIGLFGLDFCNKEQEESLDLELIRGAASQIAYKITKEIDDC